MLFIKKGIYITDNKNVQLFKALYQELLVSFRLKGEAE